MTHQKATAQTTAVAQLIAKVRAELETIEGLASDGNLTSYGAELPGGVDQMCAQLRLKVKYLTKRIETAGPNDTN